MTKARIRAAIGATAALLAVTPFAAEADVHDYVAGAHADDGLQLRIPGHGVMGTYTYAVDSPTGVAATAYCIDLTTKYREGAALREAHWADAPSIAPYAAQVTWLLHHSYPHLALHQVSAAEPFDNGLSAAEAVAATQAAVWHFSNGVRLNPDAVVGTPGEKHDVMALYTHLTGPANTGMAEVPDTTLSLSADGTDGVSGERIGPITLVANATVQLTATGASDGVRIVDAAGNPVIGATGSTELYLDVPPGTAPGEVTITATAPVQTPTGRIFVPATAAADATTQSLVLATTESDVAAATITIPWRAAPSLGTTATDASDGDRSVHPGGTVSDQVSYEGFTPGETYTLVGELVDQHTAKSTGATATQTFTPTSPAGTVTVQIPVGAAADGQRLVVFERAYDATGKLVAEHADLNSASQTVTVAAPPAPSTTAPTPVPTPAPSTTPAPSSTPAPSPSPSATPAPLPAAPTPSTSTAPQPTTTPAAADTPAPPVLADTGADAGRWGLVAGSLLLIGTGASLLGARRSRR